MSRYIAESLESNLRRVCDFNIDSSKLILNFIFCYLFVFGFVFFLFILGTHHLNISFFIIQINLRFFYSSHSYTTRTPTARRITKQRNCFARTSASTRNAFSRLFRSPGWTSQTKRPSRPRIRNNNNINLKFKMI